MGNKLEKLFEHLTGIKPDSLEPKPTGLQMAKEIKAIRGGRKPSELPSPCVPSYELVVTDTMMPAHGDPSRPYSIIKRTTPTGEQFAFIWGVSLSPEEASTAGHDQPKSTWFDLNDSCQL